ncbi:carbohydrate kinase [Amycolatopsis sp. WAC 01376]|uniref:FGGY family carbohydrate kinase n=1 Tax=Amycolatopsis sp. WAC 01376 TaxID=2203195 RepID=UPI000F798E36|nr:FGGY family carbohydrate kinase [Amycolatopsis sp. WAC 01376]RSM62951.1 carbohydrate kinase [Amycolatopsis sp. WAC 01376]
MRRGILAVDEGSTGTRAAVVGEDGRCGPSFYTSIDVSHPEPAQVEQDAMQLLDRTVDVARQAVAWAAENGVEIAGMSICTQRATAVLWDRETGRPLAPAVVWQDSRYAAELAQLAPEWDRHLWQATGRPVGTRAPFLWAARQLERLDVPAERVLFGSVDTWLVWHLSGRERFTISATNAVAFGGYRLREHAWDAEWLAALGFPVELAPSPQDDDGDYGYTDPELLGIRVPIAAVMGDQHASLIALGALSPGQGTCVHGTGTFVGALAGDEPPEAVGGLDGVLCLVAWRSRGHSRFSLEAYTSTTGSALRWLTEDLGLFASAAEISALAATQPSGEATWFVPTLAGLRTPVLRPEARGLLAGLNLATTREVLARAVIDGIAHAVSDTVDALRTTMDRPMTHLRVGGGLAASDALLQSQADFTGLAIERVADSATASLRGAAYLAGTRLGLWPSLAGAVAHRPPDRIFEPGLAETDRLKLRARWQDVLAVSLS